METALFSPSSLFGNTSDNSSDEEPSTPQNFVERTHQFPGMELIVREFSFHQLNANLLWPGTFAFSEWLVQKRSMIEGRHVIELGSGTGALAIFLKKLLQIDVTTSDYDDQEIEDNIAYNCKINKVVPALPHVKHTWGDSFSNANSNWDLIIASDILLYVKQYPNLIKTLSFLLKVYQPKGNMNMLPQNKQDGLPYPAFLMSWRRRIGKDDETLFFKGCEDAGMEVQHLGSRVYCITSKE
ncbi:protein N-terminal and lysine N-methyltransferase EFM7 [Chenopodium quinoa]|uniref:protein N-terminal and lysine N-methyltransferase EFM7 n=1 Tax=Chenopodium quinoa TaxID=63459 RepID=UPI000B79ADBF|nr:protein N-terminal and lysine N-methyltransferase EFM7 [Chenopodium quinoa]